MKHILLLFLLNVIVHADKLDNPAWWMPATKRACGWCEIPGPWACGHIFVGRGTPPKHVQCAEGKAPGVDIKWVLMNGDQATNRYYWKHTPGCVDIPINKPKEHLIEWISDPFTKTTKARPHLELHSIVIECPHTPGTSIRHVRPGFEQLEDK